MHDTFNICDEPRIWAKKNPHYNTSFGWESHQGGVTWAAFIRDAATHSIEEWKFFEKKLCM
jgi:hypothetical protein